MSHYKRYMEYITLKAHCSPSALRAILKSCAGLSYSEKKAHYLDLITRGGVYFL